MDDSELIPCEFCGKPNKHVASTSFQSCYCIKCLRLMRDEANRAIKKLKEEMKNEKRK